MNQKLKVGFVFSIMFFSFFMFPLVTSQAADGSNGALTGNVDFLIAGMPVTLRAYDLDVGADYNLNSSEDATGYDFTAPQDGDWQITLPNVVASGGASQVTFYLKAQSAGTVIATATVTVFNLQDFLVTSLIVLMGVFLLVVAIIKRVAG
jgi:hypothetical protein